MVTPEAVRVRSTRIPKTNWHEGVVAALSSNSKRKWMPKYLVLTIQASHNHVVRKLRVLIDTGATINIIKTGSWPEECIEKAYKPKVLTNAQGGHLSGGSSGTFLLLEIPMLDVKQNELVQKSMRGFFYEADIACDAIISYDFLAKHKLGVIPHINTLIHWDGEHDTPVTPSQTDDDHQDSKERREVNQVNLQPTIADSECRATLATETQSDKQGQGVSGDENSGISSLDGVEEAQTTPSSKIFDSWCRVIGSQPPVGFVGGGGEDPSLPKDLTKNTEPDENNTEKNQLSKKEKNQLSKKSEVEPENSTVDTESPSRVENTSSVNTVVPSRVEHTVGHEDSVQHNNTKRAKMARKSPWVTESYAVIDSWRDKIVEWSQLDMSKAVDAFASHQNRRFPRFWDKKQDALIQNWRHETLWINCPWSLLKQVVNKAVKDRARGIMIVPAWVEEDWFKALGAISVKWWDLPHEGPLYQNDQGHIFDQQRHWQTRAVVFDATGVQSPDEDKFGSWYDRSEGLIYTVDEMPWVEHFNKHHSEKINRVIDTGEEDPRAEGLRAEIRKEFHDVLAHTDVVIPDIPKEIRGPSGIAKIELLPGAIPKKERPFRMVGEREAALEELIQEFIAKKWIAPSDSEWASRAFVVPKAAPGEWRMVVDYRYLNNSTKVDSFPLPIIEDVISKQSKHRMWSVFDAEWGFHQLALDESSQKYTTFCTPSGVYKWLVMPMGIKNGPSIFQRFITEVLAGIPNVHVYVDDIIVGSSGDTEEELLENHKKDVARVLQALRERKVYLKGAKSKMFVREVKFCGHILKEGTRRAAPQKLAALAEWKTEHIKTVTQMKSFLGLAQWYEIYVENFAAKAGPLFDSINAVNAPDGRIDWKPEMYTAFEEIKSSLLLNAPLQIVDTAKPFIITVDASGWAVGGVLSQEDDEGRERPVAFFSRKLHGDFSKKTLQCGWSPREQETYALVVGLLKFQSWIGNNAVTIKCQTDHKSLEHWHTERLDMISGPIGRRGRWHEFFSKFANLEVVYLPGKSNPVADALSRWAYPACRDLNDRTLHGSPEDEKYAKEQHEKEEAWVQYLLDDDDDDEHPPYLLTDSDDDSEPDSDPYFDYDSVRDPHLTHLVACVDVDPYPDVTNRVAALTHDDDSDTDSDNDAQYITYRDWWDEYEKEPELKSIIADLREGKKRVGYYLHRNRLYHRGTIVVPVDLFLDVADHVHSFHHVGTEKTIELFKRRYSTALSDADIRKNIENLYRDCTVCGSANARTGKKRDRLVYHPIPPYIFSSMCLDFVDLPSVRFEKQHFNYALVIVDRLSGYIQALPCEKEGLTGEKCASMFFKNVMCFTGLPKEIMTDVDTRLTSTFFNSICRLSGVEQHNSTVYRPRSNGRAESAVKSVVSTLRKLLLQFKGKGNWVEILPLALWAINSSPGVNVNYTPHEIVFGRDAPGFGDEPPLHTPKSSANAERWIAYMRDLRQEISEKLEAIHKQEEEKFNKRHRPIHTYEVGDFVYVELRKDERPHKLGPRFVGPCEIQERLHDDTYKVATPEGIKQLVFDSLKPYPCLSRREFKRIPLSYTKAVTQDSEQVTSERKVGRILDHREMKDGTLQFKVRWDGARVRDDTWETIRQFVPQYNLQWAEYCKRKGITLKPKHLTP